MNVILGKRRIRAACPKNFLNPPARRFANATAFSSSLSGSTERRIVARLFFSDSVTPVTVMSELRFDSISKKRAASRAISSANRNFFFSVAIVRLHFYNFYYLNCVAYGEWKGTRGKRAELCSCRRLACLFFKSLKLFYSTRTYALAASHNYKFIAER